MKKILLFTMALLGVLGGNTTLQAAAAAQSEGKRSADDDQSDDIKCLKLDDNQADFRAEVAAMTLDEKNRELLDAVNSKDLKKVQNLLAAGASIDRAHPYYGTPLCIAAENNNIEIVEILLAAGADKNFDNNGRGTPLHVAAEKGLTEMVTVLVAAGADKDSKDCCQQTPLFRAVNRLKPETVKVLVAAGASIDVVDKYGHTILGRAVSDRGCAESNKGNIEITQSLVAAGATIDFADSDGHTALLLAVSNPNNIELIEILLTAGASIDIVDQYVKAERRHDCWTVSFIRWVACCLAIKKDDIEMFKDLLIADINLNFAYSNNLTPLALAEKLNRVEMVQLIKQKQLFNAIEKNDIAAFNALVGAGVDIRSQGLRGLTPLHAAAQVGNTQATQELLKAGADIYAVDKFGNTPFSSAVYSAVPDRSHRATFDQIPEKYRNIIQALVDAEFTQAKKENNEALVNQLLEGRKCFGGGVCIKPSDV